jgi:carbon monoxide dehydrogenase subunit G
LFQNTQTTLDGLGTDTKTESDTVSTVALPLKKMEKQINEEVRRMMGDLFGCLESELVSFIAYYEKMDSL